MRERKSPKSLTRKAIAEAKSLGATGKASLRKKEGDERGN
jgi:hypothetical protein